MISFWDVRSTFDPHTAKEKLQWGTLFVDCGAFGAYKAGQTIDVNEYARWLLEYVNVVDFYVNLDVKSSFAETIDNLAVLEKRYGLHPIPVFPMDAPLSAFLNLVESGYRMIALGNTGTFPRQVYYNLYSKMFAAVGGLVKADELRLHIFGQTDFRYLERYPFYSCDSSSWSLVPAYGHTLIFNARTGRLKPRWCGRPPENLQRASSQGFQISRIGGPQWWERCKHAVRAYEEYADWITKLWNTRGVSFTD